MHLISHIYQPYVHIYTMFPSKYSSPKVVVTMLIYLLREHILGPIVSVDWRAKYAIFWRSIEHFCS